MALTPDDKAEVQQIAAAAAWSVLEACFMAEDGAGARATAGDDMALFRARALPYLKAKLARKTALQFPTADDIAEFRQRMGWE